MVPLEKITSQFEQATARLSEVLHKEKSDILRDSSILRFQLAFDLSWKAIKSWLYEERGVKCASPKKCYREAYAHELIEHTEMWIDMTDDRNDITHAYKEEWADDLYQRLPDYLKLFQTLLARLKQTE